MLNPQLVNLENKLLHIWTQYLNIQSHKEQLILNNTLLLQLDILSISTQREKYFGQFVHIVKKVWEVVRSLLWLKVITDTVPRAGGLNKNSFSLSCWEVKAKILEGQVFFPPWGVFSWPVCVCFLSVCSYCHSLCVSKIFLRLLSTTSLWWIRSHLNDLILI